MPYFYIIFNNYKSTKKLNLYKKIKIKWKFIDENKKGCYSKIIASLNYTN